MRRIALLLAPLLLVAGCAERGADRDGDGEISSEEAAEEAGSVRMQPGEWETTAQLTEFDMEGMPAEAGAAMREQMGQPQTTSSCITPEQASNPQGDMFAADENDECTYREFSMSGGRLLLDATCQPEGMEGSMTLHMEGSYTPTSYALTMNMTSDTPSGPMRMSGSVEGRRVGDCEPEEDAAAPAPQRSRPENGRRAGSSVPNFDTNRYCAMIGETAGGSYQIEATCREQEMLARSRASRSSIPSRVVNYCRTIGETAGGSYQIYITCVEQELGAASSMR